MGFRFGKSIKVGKAFRINISKSGIGYSYGTKGARITHMANGRKRSTLSIPGTGLSYVKETTKKNSKKNTHSSQNNVDTKIGNQEIINIEKQHSAQYDDFINDIKNVKKLNTISSILIATLLLYTFPLFIITGILGIIFKVYIHKKMSVNIEYEFDEESKNNFDELSNSWAMLKNNKKLWQSTNTENVNDARRNAGANHIVKNKVITVLRKLPWYLNANIKPFGLNLSKSSLIFLPDGLLIIQGKEIGVVDYADLHISIKTTNFIETGEIPPDTEILEYTWLKVNKDGSKDKRFKNNRKVPVCKYGEILITNNKNNDVLAEIMCSNPSTLIEIAKAFKEYSVFK